ncbi:diguanylate cyclase (GGDEF)-like protein [Alteromonadaceae bacterium 2753L.S.0a.02]|nr:diguanylate cyclase (GGDEF)-like protein [Alteromonadaceae bacterium 2753L.S.0a.02]
MNDALLLMSAQHELGMAIGMDLKLRPMLLHFSKVCVRRLGLSAVNYYLLSNTHNESSIRFEHYLGLPTHAPHATAPPNLLKIPHRIRASLTGYLTEHHSDRGEYQHFFNLRDIGFVCLHTIDTALPEQVLEMLLPIFKRLAISCQASLEHEQLLQAISARKKAEQLITYQLYHDDLTSLPNRRRLMQKLEEELALLRKEKRLGSLLFIDLNRFKSVNDTLGHAVGDLLLQEVANLLRTTVNKGDFVSRLSGDEFVILLSASESEYDIIELTNAVVAKVKNAFSDPIQAGDHLLHITPSIGIEVFPHINVDAAKLMRNADAAMYIAKSRGPNSAVYYQPSMCNEVELRLEIEKELKVAIKNSDEFKLVYQPQYAATGECIGAEALLRWHTLHRALSSPAKFIPVAEDTGLMIELGRWVLLNACRQLRDLQESCVPNTFKRISVNVSAVQFNQGNFLNDLAYSIDETGINPNMLCIELTESSLIKNVSDTVKKMDELRQLGIQISVDDFGTGYSSLAYLSRFPISALKIDQAFVRNLHKNKGNNAIVETIMSLGESLNLSIIAEGVEQKAELEALQQLGCEYYQGFLFNPPMTYERLKPIALEGSQLLYVN